VHSRREESAAPIVAAGAKRADSLGDLGRACDVVFLCLSDDAAVESVLFAPEGLLSGLEAGSVVVDTSTISPGSARRFAQQSAAHGVSYLDAPVSGGQQGAASGTLACMIGGSTAVVDALRELLGAFCRTVTHVGEVGAGQTVKACNQVAAAGALLGVADAISLARSQGVDPDVMRQVLLGGTARSFVLEKDGRRIIDNEFTPGFRARLMRKDLRIALQTAADGGAWLHSSQLAEHLLDGFCETGGAELDWAGVARHMQQQRPS
jgi:2-hydroxy-3-oxopropionate reductase